MKKKRKLGFFRRLVQLAAAIITNGNLTGFITGKISKSPTKSVCVPGLNCYSCPAALGACPIGALQSVLGSAKYRFSLYVGGLIALFGVLLGRFICGWLCVFGWIQDLLFMIPTPKLRVPEKADKALRYLKYIILALFVIILPMFAVDAFGAAPPYFCEYICPVGTLEGGIPLTLFDEGLRATIGFLFYWKFAILGVVIAASVVIERPFCKYLCPLGAIYGLFNKISLVRLKRLGSGCSGCSVCEKVCPMKVKVTKNLNSAECIRCGKCVDSCPQGILKIGLDIKK